MERYPTCRARYSGGDLCHRCQADLRQVLAIEQAAEYRRQQARRMLWRGRVHEAREHALNACELHRSPESVEVLALVALAARDFDAALVLWRECRQRRSC